MTMARRNLRVRAEVASLRLLITTLGRLSKGINMCFEHGLTAGYTLEYIYQNKAHGHLLLGKWIDRIYLDDIGWKAIRQRKDNLRNALIRAIEEKPQPMVVYFYTDWCGYCRQFERELLGTSEVKEYFSEVLTVRINPESGAQERQLADYYGVHGYPGFFVHSGSSKTLSKVERMVLEDGRPRIMAPGEFIDAVETAASR